MTEDKDPNERLMPGQVAEILGVDTKTVGRWASRGLLSHVRTPGGHRRYKRKDVEALMHDASDIKAYPTDEESDDLA